ncbi:hypothetical protein ACFYN3_43185 [Streptomyces lavendulae]
MVHVQDGRADWQAWQVTVRGTDGLVREHCTGWDAERGRSVAQPPAEG